MTAQRSLFVTSNCPGTEAEPELDQDDMSSSNIQFFFYRVIISYTEQKTAKIYRVCGNVFFYNSFQASGLLKALYSLLPRRPIQSSTILTSLGNPAMLQVMNETD